MAINSMLLPTTYQGPQLDIAGNVLKGQQVRAMKQQNSMRQMQIDQLPKALEEEKTQKLVAKYAGPAFELQRQYDALAKQSGREEAIKKMQPIWEPWKAKATADGLPVSDTFDPEGNMQFISEVSRLGFLKQDIAENRETQLTKRTTIKETNKGKGSGSKTQFVQIADWLQNNMTRTDEKTGKPRKLKPAEVQFEAQKIMSTGKFNEQAAATQLRKSGMSQERITEFMNFASGLGKNGGGQPETAPAPSISQPPKGAVDTGRKSGGKPVWKLPNGDYWIQASAATPAAPVNLAMNAEDVPLGSGMANQSKSLIQLRKELNQAYMQGDDQKAAEIERQIQQITAQQKNVG